MATTTKKTTTPTKTVSTPTPTQTVAYNPQTGAKLKAGESVTVNGKTFTQGSTNLSGTTSSTASSTSKSSSSGSKAGVIRSAQVKATGYSTAPAKTTGMSVAPKASTITPNAINSSKSNVVKYPTVPVPSANTSLFKNPFSGGFLSNVVDGAKSTFSGAKAVAHTVLDKANQAIAKGDFQANASEAFADKATKPTGVTPKVVDNNKGMKFPVGAGMTVPQTNLANQSLGFKSAGVQPVSMSLADGTGFVDSSGSTIAGSPATPPSPSGKGGSKAGSASALDTPVTTQKTTMTNPDGSTTETSTTGAARISAPAAYNPNTVAAASNTMQVLTDNLNQSKNDPYNKYNQKGDMIKYTETALSNLANQYSDPQQALNDYNTNPQYRAQIDAMTKLTGKTINDVAARIKPVTNGITPPQTTADYLAANNSPITGVDSGTKQILTEEQQFNANQIKIITDGLQKDKDESKSLIDFYTEQENKKDKSEREKAQFAIQKAQAEYDAQDADTEMQRVTATENLKNFLAKIGALQTDGAAGVGLANLEQKYQAQRSALRSSFELSKREIEINMNDHLNALESDRDDKIFKLNQDLSKSEREISLDVMKLNHETQKDILDAKVKYAKELKAEKDKAAKKSAAAMKGWEAAFFDTAATADYFNSLPAEFKASWKANNVAPTDGTRTTLSGGKGLAQDFSSYQKNQATAFKLSDSEAFKLQKQGVDVEAYKIDPDYRSFVNSQTQ